MFVSSVTNNEASTNSRIALPEQMLPVVITWPNDKKDRSGVAIFPVRELDPRALDLYITNKKKFEAIYGPTSADGNELLFLLQMADAIADKSLPRLRRALEQFIGPAEADKELHHPAGFHAIQKLLLRFNMRFAGAVAPVVYWSDKAQRLVFGLHCSDTAAALFLLALSRVGVNSMGNCKACFGVLIGDRANKRFCDNKCRSRFFMRQLRERQKKAREKKGKESQRAKRSSR